MRLHSFALLGALSLGVAAASACSGGKIAQQAAGVGGGVGAGAGGATATTSTTSSSFLASASSSGAPDAGPDVDNGMVSTTYPANFPSPPQVVSIGGNTVGNAKLVPVFFSNEDPILQGELIDFVAKLGPTKYWNATTSEYGVGTATSTAPIVLTEAAPGTTTDGEIQSWLIAKLQAGAVDGGAPVWPAPDDNTVYLLHYPKGTSIQSQSGSSCVNFGGYHSNTQLGQQAVVYAVIPQCSNFDMLKGIDAITGPESHEIGEAVTDPQPQQNGAYTYPDEGHFYYLFALGGGEVGDMCAQFPGVFTKFPELSYEVQRTWSNASVAAGHDPCVPQALGEVYAAAMPVQTDDLSFTVQGQKVGMKGVKIPMGQSKTIDLDLYSEADTGGPFTVEVRDLTELYTGQPALSFSLDRTSGQNGEKLHLTITPIKNGTFAVPPIWSFNSEVFIVIAHNGQNQAWNLGLVGN